MQPLKVLVIEDNEAQRKVMEFNLSREGYTVFGAGTAARGMALMKEQGPDAVITDVMLPDGNGIELLERLFSINPELVVIVITAYGTIRMAVDAIKKGAQNYITKPYEKDDLLLSLKQAFGTRKEHEDRGGYDLIGSSDAIKEVMNLVRKVAGSDVPVLITGESGTGKEVVARAIHRTGNRRHMPFAAVNCAAIPSNLLEAELFGYAKGAFTGAVKDKPGRFLLADRGVLFLDEIGSMDPLLQPKLLRVLETGYIEKLGDTGGSKVDIRIVSATNANLRELIGKGLFREDLFYRLNVVNIQIPPLRERPEDIPLLADHFIDRYGYRDRITVDRDAMQAMKRFPWYGNVRELENFVRRLLVVKEGGTMTEKDVLENMPPSAPAVRGEEQDAGSGESMDDAEKRMILSALGKTGHNKSKAAKILNIPRHKLVYRMKKFGIE